MNILHYLGGPLIGAVIGYCTNYIAVKMLFRPYKEIKIGGFTLPFTPGIIPKRQKDLAKAVGKAVGDSLVTQDDLGEMLLSENLENSVVDLCMEQVKNYVYSEATVEEAVSSLTGEVVYEQTREILKNKICDRIMHAVEEMHPAELIASEGKNAIRQKLQGTMFSMFVTDNLLDSLGAEIGTYAEQYLLEKGPALVQEQMEKEAAELETKSLHEITQELSPGGEEVRARISKIYRACIHKFGTSIVGEFHIAQMVENKIIAMDVKELEALVMSVMKHELGMIVNLGAVIGFILGILTLFF